ncbi:hypothetical protein MASR2M41_22960 [Flammeovirgaceae bacterium]
MVRPKEIIIVVVLSLILFECHSQNIVIKNINTEGSYFVENFDENNFRVVYKIFSKDERLSDFNVVKFDSLLVVNDTSRISMLGNYRILGNASTKNNSAYLLGSVSNSSLVIHIIDNITGTGIDHRIKLQFNWSGNSPCYLTAVKNNFYLLVEGKISELIAIAPDGESLWQRLFTGASSTLEINFMKAINNQLFLSFTYDPRTNKAKNELRAIDPATGNESFTFPMIYGTKKLTIDNIIPYSDEEIILTGRSFKNLKKNETSSGIPYFAKVNQAANSIHFTEIKAKEGNIYWMSLLKSPDNQSGYLIGETFTSDPPIYIPLGGVAGIIANSIATSSYSCTLRFNKIVIVKLNNIVDHEFQSYSVATRTFSVNTYLYPYRFARYAYSKGRAHYFGGNEKGDIYCVNGGNIKKYNPSDKLEQTIGTIPNANTPVVIFLNNEYAMYADQNLPKRELVFNLIKLP